MLIHYLPFLLIVFVSLWLWSDSLRAREAVLRACQRACQAQGALLLDETVCLQRTGVARDRQARLQLRRVYAFEFTLQDAQRHSGHAVALGARVLSVSLDLPQGRLFDDPD